MLGFMGLQRVGHNWATELNWNELGSSDLDKHKHVMEWKGVESEWLEVEMWGDV